MCDNVTSAEAETQKQTVSSQEIKRELTNCTYLEDSSVQICGLKIYGGLSKCDDHERRES